MTDERIEELAQSLREHVADQFKYPYDYENSEPLDPELEPHEIEAVASEVERTFIKTLYLIEFKRLRAKGRLLEPKETER